MIKKILRKLVYGYKSSSKSYIDYLKKRGVTIGKDCQIYTPDRTFIDLENPFLISIGNNVKMTGPITILTHDYSWCVWQHLTGEVIGSKKPVSIGNNVFIGWGATILPGSIIGNDVIIGAQSVVTGNCVLPGVYVGNPARMIMSIEDFFNKRRQRMEKELKDICEIYWVKKGKYPPLDVIKVYFENFYDCDLNNNLFDIFDLANNKNSYRFYKSFKGKYSSYNDFLEKNFEGEKYNEKNN